MDAYDNRGNAKADLRDYQGAISDYNKAIRNQPDYALAYTNRGITKEDIGDLKGACTDWSKATEFGDSDAAQWIKKDC